MRKFNPQQITPKKESIIFVNNIPIDRVKAKKISINSKNKDEIDSFGLNKFPVSSPIQLDLKRVSDPLLRQYEEIFQQSNKIGGPDLFIVDQENFSPRIPEENHNKNDGEENKSEDIQTFAIKHSINTSKSIVQSHDRFKQMMGKCQVFSPYMKEGKLYIFQQEQTKLVINPETLKQGYTIQ